MRKRTLAAIIISASLLPACGKTTIIREVQATTSTVAESTQGVDSDTMSASAVIAEMRQSTPSLNVYTDGELYNFMTTICDKINEWAPNYTGYLLNAKRVTQNEGTALLAEVSILTVGAITSVCTWHKAGFTKALNEQTRN